MLVTIKNGLKKYRGWLAPFHDQRRMSSWLVVVWPIYFWAMMKQWRVKLRRIAWVGEGCKWVFSASSSSSSCSFLSNGAFQRDFPFLLSQYIFWQHPPSQILPTWTHCKTFYLLVLGLHSIFYENFLKNIQENTLDCFAGPWNSAKLNNFTWKNADFQASESTFMFRLITWRQKH